MLPAHAPLPTDSSFPFQAESGIQTSILISESLVGLSITATRQNGGSFEKLGAGNPGNVGTTPGGSESCPAATVSAKVTVACGRARLAKFSQVAAARGQEEAATKTRNRMCIHNSSAL